MSFIENIKARAKSDKKTIVLPETSDIRTLKAAHQVLAEGIANVILIGDEAAINDKAEGLDLSGAKIVNPATFEEMDTYIAELVKLREKKGMTAEKASQLLHKDELFLGVMMVKQGMSDGMVAGAIHATADVL